MRRSRAAIIASYVPSYRRVSGPTSWHAHRVAAPVGEGLDSHDVLVHPGVVDVHAAAVRPRSQQRGVHRRLAAFRRTRAGPGRARREEWTPELVLGIATAGVVPGAAVAAILGCPFHSILISRRYSAERVRETPAVFGAAPAEVRGRRVLVVDETCDSGQTLRLAVGAAINAGALEVRSAVSIRTGPHQPDYHALATQAMVVLPWDREILIDGELRPNPKYAGLLPHPVV